MPESSEQASAVRKSRILRRFTDWLVRCFMPVDADALARQAWLERKLLSGLVSLVFAGVIWGVSTLSGTVNALVRLTERLDAITIRLDGTYSASDATRDMADLRRRLDGADATDRRHDASLESVARRVDRVEFVIEREHHIDMRPKPAAKDIP